MTTTQAMITHKAKRVGALTGCLLLTASFAHGQENVTAAPKSEAPQDSDRPAAAAQTNTPETSETEVFASSSSSPSTAELQEMKDRADKLERDMQQLRQELDVERAARAEENERLSRRFAETPKKSEPDGSVPVPKNLSEQSTTISSHETMRGDHDAGPRPGNAPLDPEYKGFVPLFGGKTWVKFGGYAKVDAILDSTRLGNPNKFATASIPVDGDAEFGSPEQFNLIAKQSRLNFELRAPTDFGSVRFVYENDFYGNGTTPGMVYNLRHLYIQFANLTVGQTWTTFLDPDTIPDTLDFAGPGVQAVLRQPQVRYTFSPVPERLHVALALEAPTSDLTLAAGGEARRLAPDTAASVRFEGELGHIQLGAVARVLSYDNGGAGAGHSAFGFGVSASGKLNVGDKDALIGSVVYGDGIGRYMQDLGANAGGTVDANGDVQTTAAFGFFAGYRHFWLDSLSSQVTYGYLHVLDSSDSAATSYNRTHYGQGNLVWSPFDSMSFGGELLYGHKINQGDSKGDAFRGMLSVKYKLNR